MKNKSFLILVVGYALASSATFADTKHSETIFKCINSKGAVYYNDKPCPANNKETRLKAVKDPQGSSVFKGNPTTPVFIKKDKGSIEKVSKKNRTPIQLDENKVEINELEGGEQALKEQLQREVNVKGLVGSSDADKSRARANDLLNNPPAGSRKPASGSAKKLTEKEFIEIMKKNMAAQK